MALLVTPTAAAPLLTTARLAVPALYAVVQEIQHEKSAARFRYLVNFYASAEARDAGAEPLLLLDTSPLFGYVEASAAQVNLAGCYSLAYAHLHQQLAALWPSATLTRT